jgi:hypothetical protein
MPSPRCRERRSGVSDQRGRARRDWRLPGGGTLFAPDCRYLVPNMGEDPHASPDSTLYLIAMTITT